MLENYRNLASLGISCFDLSIISMLEQGKEPFTVESQVQIARNPDGWEWIKAVITALSSEFVMKDLPHKGKSNTGEVFQTVMLERQESQDIEGCSFREVQKNT
ncbi:ZNF347 isoform 6, partial [Pan troglodytes]